jgi:hypothetical protein
MILAGMESPRPLQGGLEFAKERRDVEVEFPDFTTLQSDREYIVALSLLGFVKQLLRNGRPVRPMPLRFSCAMGSHINDRSHHRVDE